MRRRDALVYEEFQLLLGAERAGVRRQIWKENRAPGKNLNGCAKGVVVFARSLFLVGRRSFGKVFRFRLLLRSDGFSACQQYRAESQSPGAEVHFVMVTRAELALA